MTPGLWREAATWAMTERSYSQRRACRLIGYRRLHILLECEEVTMNHKKLFRLYRATKDCQSASVATGNGRWARVHQ